MTVLEPINVETEVACHLLGCRRTKLFRYLREGLLERRKFGRKTVVTMESIKALAMSGHA